MSNVGKRDHENMTFLQYRGPRGNEEWKALCEGRLVAASWNSKGAAEAGLTTEQRRAEAKREAKQELEEEKRVATVMSEASPPTGYEERFGGDEVEVSITVTFTMHGYDFYQERDDIALLAKHFARPFVEHPDDVEVRVQSKGRSEYADEREEVEPMPRIQWPPASSSEQQDGCLPIGDAVAQVAEKLFRVWQGVAPDLNVADNDEAVDAVIDRAYDDLTTAERFIIAHHKDAVRDKLKLV